MKSFALLTLYFVLLFAQATHAQKVYVPPTKGPGLDEAMLFTVNELIKSAVNQQKSYSTLDSIEGSDLIFKSKILKLGSAFILSLDKVRENQIVFSSNMKAKNFEEMDTVTSRAVRALIQEKSTAETAQVTDVTEAEAVSHQRRVQPTRQWMLGFGPLWLDNLNVDKSGVNYHLGYLWGVDPDFGIRILLDLGTVSKSDAGLSSLTLGTDYHFSREKTSFFITGGVGYGRARLDDGCEDNIFSACSSENVGDTKASGWAARAGGGIKFFRTSAVNLGVEGSYTVLFNKGGQGTPGKFSLQLIVFY